MSEVQSGNASVVVVSSRESIDKSLDPVWRENLCYYADRHLKYWTGTRMYIGTLFGVDYVKDASLSNAIDGPAS